MWFVAAGVVAICLRPSSGRDEEPAAEAPFTALHYAAVAASFAARLRDALLAQVAENAM